MKLAWFEDFLMLVEAGTFSKAAALRNVSQPAFSRRIQMLEHWLGIKLVDRHSPRFALTPVAVRFEPEIRNLLRQFHELRAQMQGDAVADKRVTVVTQHALTVSYVPQLLHFLGSHFGTSAFQVRTGGRDECIAQLLDHQAHLMLCFEIDSQPMPQPVASMDHLVIGSEQLLPVVATDAAGQPLHRPQTGVGCKLLQYPDDSFLGHVVRTHCLPDLNRRCKPETVCESAFTVALRQMALAGMGIAWLPYGLVKHDIDTGALTPLLGILDAPLLPISLYRSPAGDASAPDAIWQLFEAQWEVTYSGIPTPPEL